MKFLLVSLFFMHSLSFASPKAQVLVLTNQEQRPDYLAKLRLDPHLQSYSKYILQEHKNKASKAGLKVLFSKAQKYFLKGKILRSQKTFRQITDLALTKNWTRIQQKMIFFSFFRLAQIEYKTKKNIKMKSWMKQARTFAPQLKPNPQIFPPPLIQSWKRIVKTKLFTNWTPPESLNSFHAVSINGTLHNIKSSKTIRVPLQKANYLFLSDMHKPIALTAKLSQLKNFSFVAQTPYSNPCRSEHLPFPAPSCKQNSKVALVSLKPTPLTTEPSLEKRIQQTRSVKPKGRWKPRHWLAVGLGVAVTALALYKQNQDRTGSSSSSKDGF